MTDPGGDFSGLSRRRAVRLDNPFRADRLPLIARLAGIGFHRYRRRWAKRLGKRPGRLLFDLAYRRLGLEGEGLMSLALPGGRRQFRFNGRNLQFGAIYMSPADALYEPAVAAMMQALLAGEGAFFDIGANWGWAALYAAALPGYRGPIHAFEPLPSTFRDLARAVADTGLDGRIAAHAVALSDRAGTGRMTIPDQVRSGLARLAAAGDVAVPLARLDDIALPDPLVIKMDVEGHEDRVLAGAEACLRRARPHIVFENWLERAEPEITLAPLRRLENLGYALFVPGWARTAEGGAASVSAEAEPPTAAKDQTLVLTPMTSAQRFSLAAQINIYACPRDRLGELARSFEKMSGAGPAA